MATLKLAVLALPVVPAWFALACASVLGIEQATHDSKLDNGGTGNAAGSSNGGTGNGGTGNAGESGNAGTGTDGGGKSLCDNYCDTVSANCSGNFEQYVSKAVCMKVCARLDPGQPGDDSGNTVNCRLHFAESAGLAGEQQTNCSAAGPGGNGVCGTNCEGLCRIALDTCKAGNLIFRSISECAAACTKLQDLGHYDDSIQDGPEVQCRLYHVSAAQIDPIFHCKHVAGIEKCVVPEQDATAP
jgi:hypothetical protein